ncbi:MAG: LPS assembly lipoprotein LptE [Planctomycetota bacterium]
MTTMRKHLWVILLFAAGCGYQMSPYMKDVTAVSAPIFDNKTTWRGMEFELSNLVHREIKARTPFRLVSHPEDADIVIQGEITAYRKPALVEDANDNVIVAGSMMTLTVRIREQKTGKEILSKSRNIQSEFIIGSSETATDAEYRGRQQTLEQLSRWVVSLLEETR